MPTFARTLRLVLLAALALAVASPVAAMPPRVRLERWAACLVASDPHTSFRSTSPARPSERARREVAAAIRRPVAQNRTRVVYDAESSTLTVLHGSAEGSRSFAVPVSVQGRARRGEAGYVLVAGNLTSLAAPRWGYASQIVVDYERRVIGLVHQSDRGADQRVTEVAFDDAQVASPAVISEVFAEWERDAARS